LATVIRVTSRELDTSVGVPGPHAFSVRISAIRQRHIRVHRIPPRVRDDHDTPLLVGRDRMQYRIIRIFGKEEYFFERVLTNESDKDVGTPVICPSDQPAGGSSSGILTSQFIDRRQIVLSLISDTASPLDVLPVTRSSTTSALASTGDLPRQPPRRPGAAVEEHHSHCDASQRGIYWQGGQLLREIDMSQGQSIRDASHLYEVERRVEHAARPGFRIMELQLSPTQKVPWHSHTDITDTFYVLEGHMRLFLQDPKEEVNLNPGETHAVGAARPHLVTNGGAKSLTFLVLQGIGDYDYVPLT
jgi:mannose-6-phosphate isomerase-like protein (cupin superfamily)